MGGRRMLAAPPRLRRVDSRCLMAVSPPRLRTPSETRGRGPAGARAGGIPPTAKAAPKSTASTYA
eukprot:7968270-Alexandrium_andersonii.AAC.1